MSRPDDVGPDRDEPRFGRDDDEPLFGRDDDEVALPDHRVAWTPALSVAAAVTALTLVVTVALAAALGLEARTGDAEPTADDAALFLLSIAMLAVHAALLRYGLRRIAQYDVGFGWALLAAILANVLANLLLVVGLLVSIPVQAAVMRFRSEPRASLVGR